MIVMANLGNQSTTPVAPYVFGPLSPTTVTALTFTTLALCIICVVARFYTRFYITRQPSWDDLCMLLGFCCAIAQSTLTQLMVNNGLTRHIQTVNPSDRIAFFKASYLSLGFFPLSIGFIKVALLQQFLRLFSPNCFSYKLTSGLLIFIVVWMLAFGFISWVPCFPVARMWSSELPGRCYGLGAMIEDNVPEFLMTLLIHASSNVAIDFAIFLLAAHLIWQLGTERPNLQLRLYAMLTVGLLVNVCALCRMVLVARQLLQNSQESVQRDSTWAMAGGVILLNIEVNLSAVCASVPVFWAPIQQAIIHQWGKISVTHEVSVVWSSRHVESTTLGDEPGLTRLAKSQSGLSSVENSVELSNVTIDSHQKLSHYEDEFVQSHVDPLRTAAGVAITTVMSEQRGKWIQLR